MLDFADALASPLSSDRPDGLWPTVVVDELGVALGLAYSSRDSLRDAVNTQRGVYESRRRGHWVKGKSSGATQDLLRIDLDCDRDTLQFTVRQRGRGFCHRKTRTCWGDERGFGALSRMLAAWRDAAPPGSYTQRLFGDAALLSAKLTEEARELADARSAEEIRNEAADVLFFTLVKMQSAGVTLADVANELDRRALRVTRRPGNAKPVGTS